MAMNRTDWSRQVSDDEAQRRASARRRWNSLRQFRAAERQMQLAQLLRAEPWHWGMQRRLAERLHVSEATLSRDLRALAALPWRERDVDRSLQAARLDDLVLVLMPRVRRGNLRAV